MSIVLDGTNGVTLPATTNVQNAVICAWCNFDGTLSGTIAPRASYNVTSITKTGTGQYTVNFTNAITDSNYAVMACGGVNSSTAYPTLALPNNSSSAYVRCYSGAYYDQNYMSVMVVR